jgi:hypothetical protein
VVPLVVSAGAQAATPSTASLAMAPGALPIVAQAVDDSLDDLTSDS